MLGPSIKLNKDLWSKVKKCADAAGYSSPQEFVLHLIEKELAKVPEEGDGEEAARKLKGIGYLDFGADI